MKHIRIATLLVLVAGLSLGGGYLGSNLSRTASTPVVINEIRGSDSRTDGGPAVPVGLPASDSATDVSQAFQERFREVARATMPVVVELNVVSTVTQQMPSNPFQFFFGPQGQGGQGQAKPQERQFQQEGLGSGVLVGKNRNTVYVLTNNHVAADADTIEVVLNDGRTYTGTLVGADSLMDLALVSFETTEDIPVATLGDSDALEIGDWVFAVGNPLGFQSTVTAGIVSAMERDAQPGSGMSNITSYIQTDAAINRGNSGGALVNLNGDVVGINTWIASQTGGSIGLGFAIPINMAKRAISDFITTGEVAYSWLGVLAGQADDATAKALDIQGREGAFIYSVYLDSPAGNGGIAAGDLIVAVGDIPVTDATSLVRAVATLPPEERISMRIIRDGSEVPLSIVTSRRAQEAGNDATMLLPGISITALTDEVRTQASIPATVQGVIVASVSPGTAAAGSGLQQGDVIMAVNGVRATTVNDFYRQIASADNDEISFRLRRGDTTLILGFVKPGV